MKRKISSWLLLFMVAVGCCAAQSPRLSLPAVEVIDGSGNPISMAQLSRGEQWILVYLEHKSPTCDAFLRTVNVKAFPEIPAHSIIIVAGASPQEINDMATAHPGWSGAIWYADPQRLGISGLRIAGVPAAIGMQQAKVAWSVKGTLTHPGNLDSVLKSWIAR